MTPGPPRASLLEFMDGGKVLVLIYHVYHGMDEGGIHDWERIELLVRNVVGSPGSGEYVDAVTVTRHHEHIVRRSYDSSLNFMQTSTGKHALIWQAEWSTRTFATDKNELHFVKNPYSWVGSQQVSATARAEVNITNEDSKKNVHSVFVPEASSAAVSAWGARPLSYTTAASLTSRYDNETTASWGAVPRITYELQDLADILPTHWASGAYQSHWLNTNATDILLESPITPMTRSGGSTTTSSTRGMSTAAPAPRPVSGSRARGTSRRTAASMAGGSSSSMTA